MFVDEVQRARRGRRRQRSSAAGGVMALPVYEIEFRLVDRSWIVRRDGSSRASSLHRSQSAAERAARVLGARHGCDVVVKAVDGSIERRHEYVDVLRNHSRVVRLPRRAC